MPATKKSPHLSVPFTGAHPRLIDGKGRIVVPAPFAAAIQHESDGCVYALPSEDGQCVEVYPEVIFEDLFLRPFRETEVEEERAAYGKRIALARRAVMRGPNRISLPIELDRVMFKDDVVFVVGQADYFELWDGEKWRARR